MRRHAISLGHAGQHPASAADFVSLPEHLPDAKAGGIFPSTPLLPCRLRFKRLLPLLLLLLALPAAVQAQFIYVTNNGTITITGYAGPRGALAIPGTLNVGGIDMPVTSIANSAFQNNMGLTSITIPNSVTSIGTNAFYGCYNLTSVTIGGAVTSIGNYAFADCSSLTSVIIPNSVTNIGQNAFSYCTSLTAVYFKGNAPSVWSDTFYNDNATTVYYLPGTTGWDGWISPPPAVLWNPPVQTSGNNVGVRTNQFGFTITGTSGLATVVEASTNLVNPA